MDTNLAPPVVPGAAAAVFTRSPIYRILEHESAYWTCTATYEQRNGWKLFFNTTLRGRLYPNHAGDFRAPANSGPRMAQEIIAFYQTFNAPPVAFVDVLATPHDLVSCLQAAGFQAWSGGDSDLMLYVGPDNERPSEHTTIQVRTPQDKGEWADVLDAPDHLPPDAVLQRLYLLELADCRITGYLARVDGRAVAACDLFSSEGLGRIEAVRTHPAYRGRGLAAAVIRHAMADSIAQGNQLTYIYAEPQSDAQRLYTRLGFRTVTANLICGFIWRP
jgi:ribosomal protein S18 acetylase RimI-like enzyme